MQAAFDLLAELMLQDSANLNEGVDILMDLHFNLQRPNVLGLQQYSHLTPHSTRQANTSHVSCSNFQPSYHSLFNENCLAVMGFAGWLMHAATGLV